MKVEKQQEAIVYQEGVSEDSIGMSLDLESTHMLMQMMSKNLYSDSIGSTIRECASNALDSHRRINSTDPIIVSFRKNVENNYEFSVEDFGTGLDADDVKNIISKYGKSTKRNSDTELGMMGLGFKAPLAYSSSFYFICRKDGIERKYIMYEGEEQNTIDLLFTTETKEKNGVKIIVPVNYGDRAEFVNKIKEQLCYFKDIFFDVESIGRYDEGKRAFDNNFSIFREQDFQISEICQDKTLHICLDDVYYPIDWAKLGVVPIPIAAGLRFSLTDGIFPTPNRESIRYNAETKQKIKEKIVNFSTFLVSKYNEKLVDEMDIVKALKFYDSYSRQVVIGGFTIETKDVINLSRVGLASPKINGVKLLDISLLHRYRSSIFTEYSPKYHYYGNSFKEAGKGGRRDTITWSEISGGKPFYLFNNVLSGLKKSYLREEYLNNVSYAYFIKKTSSFTLGNHKSNNMDTYYELLHLSMFPKNKWREVISEFRSIIDSFISNMEDIDNLVISQKWLDDRKTKKTKVNLTQKKLKGDISTKIAVNLERYVSGRDCKFVPKLFKLEDIPKIKKLIVYTLHEDNDKLDELYKIVNHKILLITVSSRELKIIQELNIHNLISYEKFMEGKNKPFKRLATSYFIHIIKNRFTYSFLQADKLQPLCKGISDKMIKMNKYHQEHYINCYNNDAFYKPILEIAVQNNLFDEEIYNDALEVNQVLEKFDCIETTLSVYALSGRKDKLMRLLVDALKYNKFKLDFENYIKITPETEKQVVEELTN